jgi:hypothetical protein
MMPSSAIICTAALAYSPLGSSNPCSSPCASAARTTRSGETVGRNVGGNAIASDYSCTGYDAAPLDDHEAGAEIIGEILMRCRGDQKKLVASPFWKLS